MANQADLRIVLVGKTGSGKSSSGNTILGMKDPQTGFKEAFSAVSVTKTCERKERKNAEKIISVIDTPGLFGERLTEEELKVEMVKCVEMSVPGPHAFLLVIKVGRFTEEEKNTVKWIQKNFGEDAAKYTFVLFTHTDQLKGKPIDEFISESNDLKALVNECGGRFHSFNNEMNNRDQVTEVLKKIENMLISNGREHYTNEMYREAQKKIESEARMRMLMEGGKLALMVGGLGLAGAAGKGGIIAGRAAAEGGIAAIGKAAVSAAGSQVMSNAGKAAVVGGAAAVAKMIGLK